MNYIGLYGAALKQERIFFVQKSLRPHITLGRQIVLKKEIDELINLLTLIQTVEPLLSKKV